MADFLSRLFESDDISNDDHNKLNNSKISNNTKFTKIHKLNSHDPGYRQLLNKIHNALDSSETNQFNNNHDLNDESINSINILSNSSFDFLSIKEHQMKSETCKIIYENLKNNVNVNNFCRKDGLIYKLVGKNKLKRILLPD